MNRIASIFFWFGLTLVVSLALYGTSYRVQELSKELRTVNAQIEAEQANIHVLKAEWVYLSNPARIEMAARKYLAMHPTEVAQIAKLGDLPEILPTEKEAETLVQRAAPSKPVVTGKHEASVEPVVTPAEPATRVADKRIEDNAPFVNTHMTMGYLEPPQTAPGDTMIQAVAEAPYVVADVVTESGITPTVGAAP